MRSTARIAKSAFTPHSGCFATLRAQRGVQGSGAPARALIAKTSLVVLVVLVALMLLAAPVFAAAPEKPETGKASAVTATTAVLEGTLNPGVSAKAGWYFAYSTEMVCALGGQVPPSPAAEETVKAKHEAIEATGLEPNKTYTFCLVATNEAGEATQSANEETFKTEAIKPTFGFYSAPDVAVSEVRLEAIVNPNNESTECHFQYWTKTVAEHEVPCEHENENLKEGGEQGDAANVTGLTQHTLYHYRVILKNATGETEGIPQDTFMTITPEPPETRAATDVTSSSATLNGVLDPQHEGEEGSYEFVYRQSSANECGHEEAPEHTTSRVEHAPATAGYVVPPEEVTGLLPGATYAYCLLARTSEGVAYGLSKAFTTSAIPATVGGESASSVGSSSATLHAQIDPGGALTTYFFEYGPHYESKTPVTSAGAGSQAVSVLATLDGLTPETTYAFRVVVSNEKTPPGGVSSSASSFSTYAAGVLGLPDGRSYELVSPLQNQGDATVLPASWSNAGGQAAPDGSAVTYKGSALPVGGVGAGRVEIYRRTGNNVFLAQRSGAGGWTAADIQPSNLQSAHYQGFSSDLSLGILGSEQALIEGAPNGEGQEGLYTRDSDDGSYQLLAASAGYEGATANDGNILLKSSSGGLYDSVGGKLEPVNVLPDDGGTAQAVAFGAPPEAHLEFFLGVDDLERAISADGSRIFWTTLEPVKVSFRLRLVETTEMEPKALYVREDASSPAASTVQLDVSQVPAGEGAIEKAERATRSGGGRFWGANSEGSKVFFTDEHQLTSDSNAEPGAPDLYEYDFDKPTGERLIDLTAKTDTLGEHADVVGVLGSSEDGSYVYFAAAGALAPGIAPQQCLPPYEEEEEDEDVTKNKCNIYVVHDGEAPRFVATVAAADGSSEPKEHSGVTGDWIPDIGRRSAYVTPGGQNLVFESIEDLTGFNSAGGREIYMYDFGSALSCVSCNPSGTSTITPSSFFIASYEYYHSELPLSESSTYALRDVSTNGARVFFQTSERLVSQESYEEQAGRPFVSPAGPTNVYEWERDGSGSCAREKGCLYLLSGGTSTDDSFFVDASESGDDVFMETRAQLVPQDHGEVFEVYDARVGAPQEPTPSVCTGSGCQGVPGAPPIFATPSSVTFTGVGNFTSVPPAKIMKRTVKCKKPKRLSDGKCVRRRKKAAKANRAHGATNDRGAE